MRVVKYMGYAENLDLTETLMEIRPPQDWSTSRSGGLRRTVVRDDLHQPSAVAVQETEVTDEVEEGPKPESPEDAFLREIGII